GEPEYYVVTLPLVWFLQCRLPAKLVDPLLQGQFLRDTAPDRFELDLRLFQTWTRDLERGKSEPNSAVRLELHARLQRLADNISPMAANKKRTFSAFLGEG